MTSKEALNEICKECNRASDCDKKYGACPNFNKIWEDLEDYEELIKIMGTPIEKLQKDLKELEKYRNEKYKHWNIFFNGAKLEYLLYLEQKGKESFMTSISEELYSKIRKHFLE